MNTKTIISLLALAAVAPAAEQPVPSVPMRERVSHDVLAQRLAKRQESLKNRAAKLPPPAAKTERRKPVNLLERSEFLCYRGLATLIPKGSLLNVPANYADRTRMVKGAKIVRWAEFLRSNHGWISTLEVSRQQAEADVPLTEEALESIRKNPRVIVATLSSGPITVLRKAPEAAVQTAAVNAEAGTIPTPPIK